MNKKLIYFSIVILAFLSSCSQNSSREQVPTNEEEALIQAVDPFSYLINARKGTCLKAVV